MNATETRSQKSWPVDGWTVLNSMCGYASFAFFCLTLPLFLPLAMVLPGGRRRWIAAAMRFAMRTVFTVTPTVSWRCDGDVAALKNARVVVANHEGMLDVLAACSLPGIHTLLAKTWIFRAFPMGIAARAAGLYNSDELTPEDFQEGATALLPDPRVGILVFPEGSRSRDGAVQRFRPGAFVLAKNLNVPVVPVVIAGSRLGICPGSMWIHPTRVHSRILSAMHPQPEESHRQFAARVREVMVHERHRLMGELLRHGALDRHRRYRAFGLSSFLRRQIAAEERQGHWRTFLDVPFTSNNWLFLGCEWSTMALTVRLLHPQPMIQLIETNEDRLTVARHQWLQDRDQIATHIDQITINHPTSVMCSWAIDHPERESVLARLAEKSVTMIIVRGPLHALDDFVSTPFAADPWSVWVRRTSVTNAP